MTATPVSTDVPHTYIGCPGYHSTRFSFLNTTIPQANPDKQWDIPWNERTDLRADQLTSPRAIFDAFCLTPAQSQLLGEEARLMHRMAQRHPWDLISNVIPDPQLRAVYLADYADRWNGYMADFTHRWAGALNIPVPVITVPLQKLVLFEARSYRTDQMSREFEQRLSLQQPEDAEMGGVGTTRTNSTPFHESYIRFTYSGAGLRLPVAMLCENLGRDSDITANDVDLNLALGRVGFSFGLQQPVLHFDLELEGGQVSTVPVTESSVFQSIVAIEFNRGRGPPSFTVIPR